MVQPRTGSDQQTACASVELCERRWAGAGSMRGTDLAVRTSAIGSRNRRQDRREGFRNRRRNDGGRRRLHAGNRQLLSEALARMMVLLLVAAVIVRGMRRGLAVDLRRQHRPAMPVRREHQTRDEHTGERGRDAPHARILGPNRGRSSEDQNSYFSPTRNVRGSPARLTRPSVPSTGSPGRRVGYQ